MILIFSCKLREHLNATISALAIVVAILRAVMPPVQISDCCIALLQVFCVVDKDREMRALKIVELASVPADVSAVCENEVRLLSSLRDSGRVIALYN